MKKQFFSTLLGVIISLSSSFIFAQNTENALLWEISGKGLSKPSYLFGTFHALCQEDLTFSETFKQKFALTKQVCMEVDLSNKMEQLGVMKEMFMKDGKTLQTIMSAEDYGIVAAFFKDSLHQNIENYSRMKPMMISSLTIENLLGCKPKSLEEELLKMAKKQKSKSLGLETLAFQMSIFEKMPYTEQAKGLIETAKNYGESKKEFAKMLNAYKTHNLSEIYQMMLNSDDTKGIEEDILYKRNENWIPKIETFAKEKPTFFAVGAGHLAGERGVIELLRKSGFTVKAVE